MIQTIMCVFKLKMEGSCYSLPINRQLLGMFMVNQRRLQQRKQQSWKLCVHLSNKAYLTNNASCYFLL